MKASVWISTSIFALQMMLTPLAQAKNAQKATAPAKAFHYPAYVSGRAFLIASLKNRPKTELAGVMQFAKEHKVDLEAPAPVQIRNGKVFVGKDELKYDPKQKSFLYKGYVIHPTKQPADLFIRDLYKRFSEKKESRFNFSLFPEAFADQPTRKDAANMATAAAITDGAGLAMFTGGLITAADAEGTVAATVGGWTAVAGGVAMTAALILFGIAAFDFLASSAPLTGGDYLKVIDATCGKDGLAVKTNDQRDLTISRVDGKLVIKVNGQLPPKDSDQPTEQELGNMDTLMAKCEQNHPSNDDLKKYIQSGIDEKIKSDNERILRILKASEPQNGVN